MKLLIWLYIVLMLFTGICYFGQHARQNNQSHAHDTWKVILDEMGH